MPSEAVKLLTGDGVDTNIIKSPSSGRVQKNFKSGQMRFPIKSTGVLEFSHLN
jgi:hypothetical protein